MSKCNPLLPTALEQLHAVADYQFGQAAAKSLFQGRVRVQHSKRTGRVRHIISSKGDLLATLRAKDGYLALSTHGAERLLKAVKSPRLRVIVRRDVGDFIRHGRNVFAKHVVAADSEIRPEGEVLIVDEDDKLLGVGKAILTGREMTAFKTGAAVKTRRGVSQ